MDCVNHTGATATAYCQNCGKALCASCVRTAAGGQILCEPCWTAWQNQAQPFVVQPPGAPNPATAAVLGLIPGVGAMYNGQFFKGLIHVVIFAVLISITDHYGIFGLFIAAWILYQSFEAYHTAKARRDGEPLPDPFGLNEVGNWLNLGAHPQPGAGQGHPGQANPGSSQDSSSGSSPGSSSGSSSGSGAQPQGAYQPPYQQAPDQNPYQVPYQGPYRGPYTPLDWRRREPIGALVLIALGVLFLLAQMDVLSSRVFAYMWPLLLIGLGVWLLVRRLGETHGGPK